MKICVIDIGGGMRDIYGAGVFDCFLDNGIKSQLCIGVSGGSANCASFLAGQYGRNFFFYAEYSGHKDYMGIANLKNTGSFLNLDYIYSTLSDSTGLNPLNFGAMMKSDSDYIVVATDAETAQPHYFTKEDFRPDDYSPLKASCAIPIICKPVQIDDHSYYDGGVSNPIPIELALNRGFDKIIVIIPRNLSKIHNEHYGFSKVLFKNNPEISRALIHRQELFRSQLNMVRELEKAGKAIIITPTDSSPSMLERAPKILTVHYRRGYNDAKAILNDIKD